MSFFILRARALMVKASLLIFVLTLFTDCIFAAQIATPTSEDHLSQRPERLARITATPNPVSAGTGQGTTMIAWRTGDGAPGEVRVAIAGEPEKLFARGAEGSQEVDWITPDSRYEFRLYSRTEPETLLATLEVTGNTEMISAIESASRTSGAINSTRIVSLLFFTLLLAGACYVSWRGNDRLAKFWFVALAVFAIAFALLSVILVEPRPLSEQPFPDAQEYADATRQLVSGEGYVTYVHGNVRHPPRYPPGFSLALVPFAIVGNYPSNVQMGAKLFAALYVLAAVFAAWRIGGWFAAAIVAAMIGVSPFARTYASLVLSDAFAAGMTVLFIPLLHRLSTRRVALAGMLAGALIAVRLPMVLNIVALLIVLPSWAFRRNLILFASPFVVALGLYNWMAFGSPLRSGYSYWLPGIKNFDWSFAVALLPNRDGPLIVADALKGLLWQWMCPCSIGGPQATLPNILFYPAILLGTFWIFAPPFVTLLGLVYVWTERCETAAKFTLWLTLMSLMLYTFYFHQGTRFMAAPATLLLIYAAVAGARRIERINSRTSAEHAES